MTKPTTKAKAAAKQSTPSAPLIVLGCDEQQAAQFPAADAELVAKAARLMDLKVYEAVTEDLAALAKKLPVGRLYSNGRGFVPNVRQSLYSEIIATLAVEPQAAVGKDKDELPVATGRHHHHAGRRILSHRFINRHYSNTRVPNSPKATRTIQKLMGHRHTGTTALYCEVSDTMMRNAVELGVTSEIRRPSWQKMLSFSKI
jgi:hypothetical protein